MELILKLVQQKIDTVDEVKELTDIQQKQLAHGLKMYFGRKTTFKTAFNGECIVDYWKAADKKNPAAFLYDFWQINSDSGGVFFTDSLNETGVEMIQGYFDVQAAYIGNETAVKLAQAFAAAQRIKEIQSEHELNQWEELEAFSAGAIVPADAKTWLKFLKNQKVSENIVRKYHGSFNKACWDQVSARSRLSAQFLTEFEKRVNWSIVSQYQKLPIELIRTRKDELDWNKISLYQELNEDQMREFAAFLNWDYASGKQKMSEDFMRQFAHKIAWDAVSWGQVLSAEFIREFQDRLNWKNMCMYQRFSEDQMREFSGYFDWNCWNYIWMHQKISPEFLNDYKVHIQWQSLSMNHKLTNEDLETYKENILWESLIGLGRGLSEEQLKKFEKFISNPVELSQHNWKTILSDKKRFPISDAYRKEIEVKFGV
ncbi:MAG TPA: hypothetical protein VD905_21060 [Flavobacteriales bacterium]|nr:hypothetical protein [Flavobacteriales bacterium]